MLCRDSKRALARLIHSTDCLDIYVIIRIMRAQHNETLTPRELVSSLGAKLRRCLLENLVNQPWVGNPELMAHGFTWEEIVNMRMLASRKQHQFEAGMELAACEYDDECAGSYTAFGD